MPALQERRAGDCRETPSLPTHGGLQKREHKCRREVADLIDERRIGKFAFVGLKA